MNKSKNRKLVVSVLVIAILLYFFPFYRIAQLGGVSDYYSRDEIAKLMYSGSIFDRMEAQSVIHQANVAFQDYTHIREENRERYGVLSRYATSIDSYDNVVDVKYSLKLWSAYLDDCEGYLWVYYSHEAIDSEGNIVCGSWRIPSLWYVEKNDNGEWFVAHIREHP